MKDPVLEVLLSLSIYFIRFSLADVKSVRPIT